ncbi:MAG: Lin1244/Lin1753 domain-containing protein [Janthinobacterium lividum]
MARPTRHNAEYFYHPADLRNDRRVKAIQAHLGIAGYGLLLMLLEVLTDADHNRLDTDEVELELLAGDLGVSVTEIGSLLQIAEKVRFFARTEAGLLHCPDLDKWLAPVYEKRNRARNAQQSGKRGVSVTETPVSAETIPPVKESKVEYSREDSNESSSEEHTQGAGEPEKKRGAENAADLTAQTPAPTPPVAAAPLAPDARRAGTYRDYDALAWPEQLHPPFETPAFHAAWAKWGKYLAELGKPHRGHIHEDEDLSELRRMAGGDHGRALEIITTTIRAGWKRLIDHKETSLTHGPNRVNHTFGGAAGHGADPTERLHLPAQVDFTQDAA